MPFSEFFENNPGVVFLPVIGFVITLLFVQEDKSKTVIINTRFLTITKPFLKNKIVLIRF
jgi:hypothetical protein